MAGCKNTVVDGIVWKSVDHIRCVGFYWLSIAIGVIPALCNSITGTAAAGVVFAENAAFQEVADVALGGVA